MTLTKFGTKDVEIVELSSSLWEPQLSWISELRVAEEERKKKIRKIKNVHERF